MTIDGILDLADYRRRVAELYAEVRRRGVDRDSWVRWVEARTELLRSHPQSPLEERLRAGSDPMRFFDYDPSWHLVGTVEPLPSGRERPGFPGLREGASAFTPVGSVRFERSGIEHRLGLYWLEGYGGGLFLPFGDDSNGDATYGAGRYLLDGAKSADLGSAGPGRLVLDFNFAYHPSCVWDPQWACPLAPAGNRLTVAVEAGERKPAVPVPPTALEYRCERCGSLTHDGDGHDCC